MSESSATTKKIMPEAKPKSSFVTEPGMGASSLGNTNVSTDTSEINRIVEAPKGEGDMGEKMMPAGKPSSSFINTSAVK